jgi:lysophospholipase L1-like esterase
LERLEKDVIRFKPDVVAICFDLNDGALSEQTLWDEWKAKLAQQEFPGFDQQELSDSIHQEKIARLVPTVPIAEFKKHLRTLVAQLRTRTQAKVYLLTFNSVSDDYQNSQWGPELRKQQRSVYGQYRDQVLEIARKMKLKSADVYQRFEGSGKSLLTADGIHPNAREWLFTGMSYSNKS